MRRIRNTPAPALLVASVAIALLARCTSLTEQPLAGGSGAGNPGGIVALSMRSGIDMPTAERSSDNYLSFDLVDSTNPINVTDSAGLAICISSVSLTNIIVHFSLDSSEAPSPLLLSMKQQPPELSTDTHSIVLSGPYLFNALEGDVDPCIRTLRLPVARYTGVGLRFNQDSSPKLREQIVMQGSFIYNGTLRKLTVDLNNCSWSSHQQRYRFAGGIFTLSKTDTTNLRLQFDAKKWFSDIDIALLLKKGSLSFNSSTGTLVITNRSPNWVTQTIGNSVFYDFLTSGRLVVY